MPSTATAPQKQVLDPHEDVLAELGRFFQVARDYTGATGELAKMPACPVDTAWHSLMADDAAFEAFVDAQLGGDVTVKHVESGGHDPIEWVPLYEQKFGVLPDVWFVGTDGSVDTEALAAYRAGNPATLSWDCTPGFGDRPVNLPKLSWDCTPGFGGRKATAPKLSWDCTPGFGEKGTKSA